MIDYKKILSSYRFRTSTRSGRNARTESESDRGRVLFSPAFRRLQQKAQVFSMEPNAAVRSRLTHSFEVSQVGRYLADEICQRHETQRGGRLDAVEQGALVNFVEAACLMHDIGNPPFGHFGEAAIQEWFKLNGRECVLTAIGMPQFVANTTGPYEQLVSQALVDFLEFDGNPQGLRIVTRLQWNTDEFGLNLTATALASFLKYVRCAGDGLRDGNFRKKAGFFTTESEIVKKVWDEFGYSSPQRFPLAYIMEAADDIAYCISDLEDSFEKEIVSEIWALPKLAELYMEKGFGSDDPCHEEIKTSLMAIRDGKLDGKEFTYTDFRTRINSAIVRYAAQRYVDDEVTIACGSHKGLLPEDEPPGFVLKVLKDFLPGPCVQPCVNSAS
jgi:dGTPase